MSDKPQVSYRIESEEIITDFKRVKFTVLLTPPFNGFESDTFYLEFPKDAKASVMLDKLTKFSLWKVSQVTGKPETLFESA